MSLPAGRVIREASMPSNAGGGPCGALGPAAGPTVGAARTYGRVWAVSVAAGGPLTIRNRRSGANT